MKLREIDLMGPDGPKYWGYIFVGIIVAMAVILCSINAVDVISLEAECKKFAGDSYIFDYPSCYRVNDGGELRSVNINLEKAILKSENR